MHLDIGELDGVVVVLAGGFIGSAVHHLVVSLVGVFLGLVGSWTQVKVICGGSSGVEFRVISEHILVDSDVAVSENPVV